MGDHRGSGCIGAGCVSTRNGATPMVGRAICLLSIHTRPSVLSADGVRHDRPRFLAVGQSLHSSVIFSTLTTISLSRCSNYTTGTTFYKCMPGAAECTALRENRKRLPICHLFRINISLRFFGTHLATYQNRPDRLWKRGRALARLANGFPHRDAHGPPVRVVGPRGLLKDSPRLFNTPPRGTDPKTSGPTTLLLSPSRLRCKSANPLIKPSAPPAEGFSFFS